MRVSNKVGWVAVVAGVSLAGLGCSSSNGAGTPRTVVNGPGPSQGVPGPTTQGAAGFGAAVGSAGSSTGVLPPVTTGMAGRGAAGVGMGAAGSGGSAPGAAGAGAGGTTATGGTGDPAACPPAPAGASAEAIAALAAVNAVRVPAGSGCDNMVLTLNMSALNHCTYYAANKSNMMCVADAHGEVMSCMNFTGTGPGQRMTAAGYTGRGGGSEVMAFSNNPQSAVTQWINSVWHRIPLLDPWTVELGYGNATGCDVIDLGRGAPTAPTSTVVVYPYDGQTGVPTSFNGANEGPMPPAPSTGWPSAMPINVYAQGMTVATHVLTLDTDTTPIDHVWLDANAPNVDPNVKSFLGHTAFMYANTPFTANTKYHVTITGMHTGGALNLSWSFTTGAASGRFGH